MLARFKDNCRVTLITFTDSSKPFLSFVLDQPIRHHVSVTCFSDLPLLSAGSSNAKAKSFLTLPAAFIHKLGTTAQTEEQLWLRTVEEVAIY